MLKFVETLLTWHDYRRSRSRRSRSKGQSSRSQGEVTY